MAVIGIEPEAYKKLLEPKHVVYFKGSTPEYWQERYAEKYFRVLMTQQIPYTRSKILAGDTAESFNISDDVAANHDFALYPDNTNTLYEILVGMKSSNGAIHLYPRFPPNEWFETLEEGGFIPTPGNDDLGYLGDITEEITPADKPQFRLHTVKDEESIGFYLWNDSAEYSKVVFPMLVNRCLIKQVSENELSTKEKERARDLEHAGLMARGKWGETAP